MREFVASLAVGSGFVGCAEPMIDAGPPGTPQVASARADGWTLVTQPGWMHVDFPRPPRSFNKWDHTHQGQNLWRELVEQSSADGFQELRMVEYRGVKDLAEAKGALPNKMSSPPPGVHVDKIEPVSIAGGEGELVSAHVDAKSSTNGAPFPLLERTEWIWHGGRGFWMDFAGPLEKWPICERFLGSFALDDTKH